MTILIIMKETVILKFRQPTTRKLAWLENTASLFLQGSRIGLDFALANKTVSIGIIHKAVYRKCRDLGLPSDYSRMAVNNASQHARSYLGLRKSKRRAGNPVLSGSTIGLGVNAYAVVDQVLRVSTGKRGTYIWLPLCIPEKWRDRLQYVKGDAMLFKKNNVWFVMLPLRTPDSPAVSDGDPTVIGVDLGIVRLAAVKTPNGVKVWNGKEIRSRREHFASVRKRYQRHGRMDKIKKSKGKERRWMADVNHKVSRELVNLANQYANPVIAFERLDGIRNRVSGSKRFNRMISNWAFRDLINKTEYKAAKLGIRVVFVNPRGTSRTCPKCGHSTRSNRPTQADFRCVACGYRGNADAVAAINITARAIDLLSQGSSDTARPVRAQDHRGLDGASGCSPSVHLNSSLASS